MRWILYAAGALSAAFLLNLVAFSMLLYGVEHSALYALYGGAGRRLYVAYVGIADSLKRRATQHLLNRDSSVATGTSAVGINPDYVTAIRWWEHRQFSKRAALEAAELVAFDVLNPALRNRKPDTRAAHIAATVFVGGVRKQRKQ
ncbi:MAG TPA: hypothetical protein VEI01_18655 [Terriglobales bacterium]|nr:hypothetical protein [Terriglobales bacterium]